MKNKKTHNEFIKKLREKIKELNKTKQGDVHVLTVNANYGRYKITIGPIKNQKNIPLEIDGEIHHLFVSPDSITTNPTKTEVHDNLKHTIIMRDLDIHLDDPSGTGKKLAQKKSNVKPREYINLAGKEGNNLLEKSSIKRRLSRAAYKIAQQDILKSLEEDIE